MTWPSPPGVLWALRRRRAITVCFFVFLALLVGAERRLAEIHLDLRSAGPGLESDDVLDGDEIRVRLVVLNDDKPPTISDAGRTPAPLLVPIVPQRRPSLALGRPAPRGPPVVSSSLG